MLNATQAAKIAACAGVGMAAAPFLAAPALGLVGFTAVGPVAGKQLFVTTASSCMLTIY